MSRAKTQSTPSSEQTCFCLSSSPDKQKTHSLCSLRLCGEFLKKFFKGLAQPKADPSSGGVLARKPLFKRSVENLIGINLKSKMGRKIV